MYAKTRLRRFVANQIPTQSCHSRASPGGALSHADCRAAATSAREPALVANDSSRRARAQTHCSRTEMGKSGRHLELRRSRRRRLSAQRPTPVRRTHVGPVCEQYGDLAHRARARASPNRKLSSAWSCRAHCVNLSSRAEPWGFLASRTFRALKRRTQDDKSYFVARVYAYDA